ncbi:pyridoxamine 5'-phosphate oxidase family protein [Jiangella mangrovi]|uniref:Nitroimidazol reductase NimA-like FMN-containing flavoprotein (Pyridoxamine 5'-phosphate oxidase superfamily) n=1 Tax=Jiangella mangrovi TaxID=1524084 RepID=A0A7W9LMS4_9ACTN|nr:pyridoxamine 5'-phosphate oxidase family protein [Jiangella mangrovi]MBB5789479.1 nitroimidazol reductase NimA-like FMN-containing flavoprotein (pyridoxamine 5'-phosphate oxidase superfamily) [Jiangella mangrovi]
MTEEPQSNSMVSDGSPARAWAEAVAALAAADTYWLSTVRADGRPHVVPILGVVVDGAFHFAAWPGSVAGRNLAANPRCVVAVNADGIDLAVEGRAVPVRDEPVLQAAAARYLDQYDWPVEIRDGVFHADGAPTAGPGPFDVYALTPSKGFGYGSGEGEPYNPTRWRFG